MRILFDGSRYLMVADSDTCLYHPKTVLEAFWAAVVDEDALSLQHYVACVSALEPWSRQILVDKGIEALAGDTAVLNLVLATVFPLQYELTKKNWSILSSHISEVIANVAKPSVKFPVLDYKAQREYFEEHMGELLEVC